MIVIVEGIDRVGKSTLVEKIKKSIGFYAYHNSTAFSVDKMDNANETDKMLKMLSVYDASNPLIIFDRFHWTDYVYGCLDRGYDYKKAVMNLMVLEEELKERDARIILVKPENILESSSQHGSNLLEHSLVFDALFSLSKLKKYECTYSTLDEAVEWTRNEVQLYMEEHGC